MKIFAILAFLFCFSLAQDTYDPSTNYRPRNVTGLGEFYSWVGSYYNATAVVELEVLFGREYGKPLCPQSENQTYTTNFDVILSILERGHWDSGDNSVIFLLTLLPQISPLFNVSNLTFENMWEWRFFGHQDHKSKSSGSWHPESGSSPDLFNFTTSQVSGGAYNISVTLYPHRDPGGPSYFGILSGLPLCDSTKQTDGALVTMMRDPDDEALCEFQYPHTSIQFDDKTADFTLDASFQSTSNVHENSTSQGITVSGLLRVRFSGVLDAYHSDTLSLKGSTPEWLRTVGFSNDSSNIGYRESSAGKLYLGIALTSIVIILAVITTAL
ncbi:unnamed protein product [Fusarium graminearum]|nr:unnamed protein product [Fusarium graminearum]CAG2001568.1 unnamed protein product [Fusarium graminearum]